MKPKKKRKNPSDLTQRNLKAAKKREAEILAHIEALVLCMQVLTEGCVILESRIEALEKKKRGKK